MSPRRCLRNKFCFMLTISKRRGQPSRWHVHSILRGKFWEQKNKPIHNKPIDTIIQMRNKNETKKIFEKPIAFYALTINKTRKVINKSVFCDGKANEMRQISIAKVQDNTKSHLSTRVVGFSIVFIVVVVVPVPNQAILLHWKFWKLPIIIVLLRRFRTFFTPDFHRVGVVVVKFRCVLIILDKLPTQSRQKINNNKRSLQGSNFDVFCSVRPNF